MLRDATVTRNSVDTSVEAMSRRALLTASAGLLGAAALAPDAALAQAPAAPPTMPASQAPVRNDWLAKHTEDILEPGLPIIDPHHHLYDRPRYTYLFPDLLADVGSGHNIRATLYEQAGSMYRADGPEELKSLGETEFVCGVAAMSASGNYGPTRCIAGVVGYVDLRLASRAKACSSDTSPSPTAAFAAFATARPGATIRCSRASAGPPGRDCTWTRTSAKASRRWSRWI
jgi:hypothetical protein